LRYDLLEGAGILEVTYSGPGIDVYSLGVLNSNLQDIIDKVAFWFLSQDGLLEPTWRRPRYLPNRIPPAPVRFIRADIRTISTGSLHQEVAFGLAIVLSDPDVRAILQNLAADIVWAIGASGIRGIRSRPERPPLDVLPLKNRDPFDIGPNMREVLLALSERSEGGRLRLRSQRDNETVEVVVEIEG
jgi:hypothetical protein